MLQVPHTSRLSGDASTRAIRSRSIAKCRRARRRASGRSTTWDDGEWMRARDGGQRARCADVDLRGASRLVAARPGDNRSPAGYREIAPQLADYVREMGFTHVELMPHHRASVLRLVGLPDDRLLRADVALRHAAGLHVPSSTMLHQRGIGVILDWVPSHFPSDAHGLALLRRHAPLRARRSAPGLPSRVEQLHLQLRPPRGARLPAVAARCSGSTGITSTACAWTRSPRCSTSTTRARPASGCRTSTAAARTSRRSSSCASSTRRCTAIIPDVQTIAEESTAWPHGVAPDVRSAASASA